MSDIHNIVNQTVESDIKSPGADSAAAASAGGEKNKTDPKVCHDPSIEVERVARYYFKQNKYMFDEGEWSGRNNWDTLKLDGIEYPLIVINERNIEAHEIIKMNIDYSGFLPSILLVIKDIHQEEQKINTTQMSSIIRACIVSRVDKVYKKILLNFRTYDVQINPADPTIVTYYGTYYVKEFRQVNTKHIWMPSSCGAKNCGQGGHINANTWEMLHKIAELTGLGFAATKNCKEIEDRVIRNIYSQRYDQYIEQQLLFSGNDENNIFDAWVDLYGYIVMVNLRWVLNEDINPNDLTIMANVGTHSTTNNLMEEKPLEVTRLLTNFHYMGIASNLEIASYNMNVDNDSVAHGTLEQVYSINFDNNMSSIEQNDVQSKQNSIDGEHIEDYNTGKNRPLPKFNFNSDAWTGLSGGYDLHKQKIIRNAYFRKIKQSMLNVVLQTPNLGLQRGTLVNILIFDDDSIIQRKTFANGDNVGNENQEKYEPKIEWPKEFNQNDIMMDPGGQSINLKLSGLYYIDSMTFEYTKTSGAIIQTLHLIKRGSTSGYNNRYTSPRIADVAPKPQISQSPAYEEENNIK